MAEFSRASGTTTEARTVQGWPVVTNFLHLDGLVSGGLLSVLVYFDEVVEPFFTNCVDKGLVDQVLALALERKCPIEDAANTVAKEMIEASERDTQAALLQKPKLVRPGTLFAFEAERVPHATQALVREG